MDLEIIEDAGHFPHKDHPERFTEVVDAFIRSTRPATYSRARFRDLLKNGRAPETPLVSVPHTAGADAAARDTPTRRLLTRGVRRPVAR